MSNSNVAIFDHRKKEKKIWPFFLRGINFCQGLNKISVNKIIIMMVASIYFRQQFAKEEGWSSVQSSQIKAYDSKRRSNDTENLDSHSPISDSHSLSHASHNNVAYADTEQGLWAETQTNSPDFDSSSNILMQRISETFQESQNSPNQDFLSLGGSNQVIHTELFSAPEYANTENPLYGYLESFGTGHAHNLYKKPRLDSHANSSSLRTEQMVNCNTYETEKQGSVNFSSGQSVLEQLQHNRLKLSKSLLNNK